MKKPFLKHFYESNINNTEFCFVCGSFPKAESHSRSDIDIFYCVKDLNLNIQLDFNEYYFSLHKRYFQIPDLEYPGELVSYKNLYNRLKNGLNIQPEKEIKSPQTYDILVWSGMLSETNYEFYGNNTSYVELKKLALKIIDRWYEELADQNSKLSKLKDKIQYLKQNTFYVNISDNEEFESITTKAKDYVKILRKNKTKLEELLLSFESHETYKDEYEKSIDALENFHLEFQEYPRAKTRIISSFLPLNLPLYSTVLFALIPSLYAEHVLLRPPSLLTELYIKLFEILKINKNFISLIPIDRTDFVKDYANKSNVVIFVGKYNNALNLVKTLRKNILFIYTGYGINPIVVTENANLQLACEDTLKVKIFNNGQDCAGADAILVHEKIQEKFIKLLIEKLNTVKIGKYTNKEVRIGPMLDKENVFETALLLKKYSEQLIYGGQIDFKNKIVYPTIILQNINDAISFEEFYSPIFKIITYKTSNELEIFFKHTNYIQNRMYVSIYGNVNNTDLYEGNIILNNKTIHAHEKGNYEYGGFGKHANFVSIGGEYFHKPILVSREINNFLKTND